MRIFFLIWNRKQLATLGRCGGVDSAVDGCRIDSGFLRLVRFLCAAVGIGWEMKRNYSWLGAIPYLAALISCAPLIAGGFPQGHDWTFELARVAEFSHALDEGQFPPHWAPNLYGGYGSPVFLFYAPAFVALAVAASPVFDSAAAGASLAVVLFSFVGVFAIRRLFDAIPGADLQGGRIAATVFALHPYLIGDKLIRNANAEFAALCLLPFALEGLMRLERQPLRGAVVVAGGLAVSILSHNLTAMICLALLLGGTLWLHGWRNAGRTWMALVSGLAVGLLIAAFVWLPALALRDAINIDDLTRGKFDFHNQWKPIGEFFGYSQFFSAGALTPAALILAAWVGVRRSAGAFAGRRFSMGLLAAALIFIGLQLRVSTPVWESLPWLALVQFPWRFMGPLALVSAVAAGLAVGPTLSQRSSRVRACAEVAIFALCVANAWPQLASYRPLSAALSEAIVKAVQPEKLRRGALNVSVLDEYLPRGANSAVWKREARIKAGRTGLTAEPEAEVEVLEVKGSRVALRVDAPAGTRLRLPRWYFPGWEAELDGVPIPVEPNPWGGIDVRLPSPGGSFELVRRPPLSRRIGVTLSGLGVGVWLALFCAHLRRRRGAE